MKLRWACPISDRILDIRASACILSLLLTVGVVVLVGSTYRVPQSSTVAHSELAELHLHKQSQSRLPPLLLLQAFRQTPAAAQSCSGQTRLVFVREYFRSETSSSRSREVQRALIETMRANPCGDFVAVVSDPDYLQELEHIQALLGVDLTVFWSPVHVTYDRLLLAIQLRSPSGAFVLSTADVMIPAIGMLPDICPAVFADPSRLFTVSRRDLDQENCNQYRDWGSWDVFIGNATQIDDYVLDNTRYAPTFWGVENVLVFLLLRGRGAPYNLCSYLDVVHYHAERDARSEGSGRIRINHDANSIGKNNLNLAEVCDMDRLRTAFPRAL